MKTKRTLYECFNARVNNGRIYCSKGFVLSQKSGDGCIETRRLAQGERLALNVCQECTEFDRMGPRLMPEERGWLKKRNGTGND